MLLNNKGGIKKKVLIAVGAIIALLIVLKACASLGGNADKQESQVGLEQISTVEVVRRDLTNAVSVTGTIESVDARSISSDLKDIVVKEVLVSVGERVEEGQVLVRLDSTDLEKKLSTTENNYSVNQKLDALKSPKEIYDETVEKAKVSFARVEANCTNARYAYFAEMYATAKSNNLLSEDINDENYQEHINEIKAKLGEANSTSIELEAAKKVYVAAEAEALLAKDTYERAVADAQKAYEKNILEHKLVSSDSEEDKIKNYKEQIENCEIKAPMSGTISNINVTVGNKYNGGNLVEMLDNEHFKVVTNVDEYDINKIYLNQKVQIKSNATGNELIGGTVTYVAVTASEDAMKTGSARYKVEITIDGPQEKLRVGMKATANIELSNAKSVLSVPYDCIETREGKTYVTVVDGDTQKQVEVVCGLMTNYYVEISGPDIKEGTKILLGDALVAPKENEQDGGNSAAK